MGTKNRRKKKCIKVKERGREGGCEGRGRGMSEIDLLLQLNISHRSANIDVIDRF